MSLCNSNFKLHKLSAECIYEVQRSGITIPKNDVKSFCLKLFKRYFFPTFCPWNVCKKKSTFTWTKKYFYLWNPDCVDPAHHANGFMTSFDCFKLGGKKQNFCFQVVTNYTAVQRLKTRMQTLAVLSRTISQSEEVLFSRYIQLISPSFKCAKVAILVWILSKYTMLKFIVFHVLITTVWTYNQSHS